MVCVSNLKIVTNIFWQFSMAAIARIIVSTRVATAFTDSILSLFVLEKNQNESDRDI